MIGGHWLVWTLDRVAPSRMVCVFASVNLPLHHKVQMFSSGTGSPGWSWKKGHKTVVCVFSTSTLLVVTGRTFSLVHFLQKFSCGTTGEENQGEPADLENNHQNGDGSGGDHVRAL